MHAFHPIRQHSIANKTFDVLLHELGAVNGYDNAIRNASSDAAHYKRLDSTYRSVLICRAGELRLHRAKCQEDDESDPNGDEESVVHRIREHEVGYHW